MGIEISARTAGKSNLMSGDPKILKSTENLTGGFTLKTLKSLQHGERKTEKKTEVGNKHVTINITKSIKIKQRIG